MSTVVTRIPPSPTGRLHIGTARTALFNYLFAKHEGGKFIFRSEDTDKTRSKKEFEDEIIEGLTWLGLSWDSFSRQSENATRHQQLLEKIIAEGKAYLSKEPAKDDATKMVEVVRLKNPGKTITFTDEIRGDITFDTTELGDFVLAKSLSEPLYHFAVVVDDADAGVTHVIRGEDHISNTPRQILIQEALGVARPVYAHLPLILGPDRAKLSKRKSPTSLADYRAEGFLPEGLINYLALLGWNPGTEQEDFSLPELVEAFSFKGVQKSGAIWSREKLLSVNQRWMRKMGDEAFLTALNAPSSLDATIVAKALPLIKDRASTFGEAREMLSGELSCLFEEPNPAKETLLLKNPSERPNVAKTALEVLLEALNGLPEGLSAEEVKETLMPYADRNPKETGGRGAILWPLRYALSGQERSPDPFTLIAILGKKTSMSRIQKALGILG